MQKTGTADTYDPTPQKLALVVLLISLAPALLIAMGVEFGVPLPDVDATSLVSKRLPEMLQTVHDVMNTSFVNTLLAWSAFCLAIVTAMLAVLHFYLNRDVTTPIIGMAFLCVAIMEGIYTLFSAQLLQSVVEMDKMIPVLWTAARFFHALIMIGGVGFLLLSRSREWSGQFNVVMIAYLIFAGLACLVIQFISQADALPQFLFPERAISRPYDLVPLFMYLFAGLFIYPFFHRKIGSTFSLALLISVIPDVTTQIHMAFGSKALFDSHFIVASSLKIFAYSIPFLGLIWDYVLTYRKANTNVDRLRAEIGERAKAEERLEENEKRLQDFLNNANDLIMIVSPEGAFQFVNYAWCHTLGYNLKDLDTMRIEDVIAPESQEKMKRYFQRVIDGETVGEVVLELATSDGRQLQVEGSVNCVFENWQPVAVHASFRDVTERLQALEDLRKTQGDLDRFFSLSIDMLCIVGYDGRLRRVSPSWSESLGYTEHDLQSRHCVDLVHPEDRQEFGRRVKQLTEGIPKLNFECRMTGADGTSRWFSWSACPFPERQLIYASVRDDSERKRFEAELVNAKLEADEANQSKSAFLASMSHEIRTPLNAILGMADLLSEGELNSDQQKYVEVLRTSGTSLLNLINDILDLSKVEAGQLEIEAIEFEFHDLVEKVAQMLSMRAQEKGLELLVYLDREVPDQLVGDPSRLRQIMVNLLGNAIKFTEAGEVFIKVEVESHQEDDCFLKISVADTGIGIPEDRLERIFESFTQADSSVARKYGGSGLGLSICKRLVNMMGGRIWVESRLGQGTTFAFTVRLGSLNGKTRKFHIPTPDLKGRRAMVIASNATSLQILQTLLTELNLETAITDDVETGLRQLQAARDEQRGFDLVLIDAGGPHLLGIGAVGRIRKVEGVEHIVVMAPYKRMHEVKAALRRQQDIHYLVKPIHRGDLYRLVAYAFDLRRTRTRTPPPPSLAGMEHTAVQQPLRILLAEDTEDNQILFRFYLKSSKHKLDIANNGVEAVDLFKQNDYDLILMDIEMPEMNGYEATRRIRLLEAEQKSEGDDSAPSPVPIITLTAHAMEADRDKCLQAGFDGFLTKPIRKAELLKAIWEHQPGKPEADAQA